MQTETESVRSGRALNAEGITLPIRDSRSASTVCEKSAAETRASSYCAVYVAAVAAGISFWFLTIRAPLTLDETGSYWHIKDGFSEIWSRGLVSLGFPAYSYILWLTTKVIGT